MTDREAMKQAMYLIDAWQRGADADLYFMEIAELRQALAQPEQEKESTAQTVDPRLLLGRGNNFNKETENRLCDIERRLAAIETQSAPPMEKNNG